MAVRAVRLQRPAGLNNLVVTSGPLPKAPAAGEIQIRVRASSLNYHDYLVATGFLPAPDGIIPLSDGAGEVLALGPDVAEFSEGDLVVSTFFRDWVDGREPTTRSKEIPGDAVDGFACEVVTVPVRAVTHAPRGYSAAEAATLTCAGLTAWRALAEIGGVKAGDTVLTQGTGGVSLFAVQFAKAMGARVISTSSSDQKLERLSKLGADEVINYKQSPDWGNRAFELSFGGGVDLVVEVGGAGTLEQSLKAARAGGTIAVIGTLGGRSAPLNPAALFAKQLRLIGLSVGSRRHQLDMIRAIEANQIKPVIDSSFPLDQLSDAFRYQETNQHFGKIGISI